MEAFIFFSSIGLVFLFVLSAFWSLAETGLTSLSKYRVKKIIALNKSLAGTLKQWLKSPYYILTTILVGDTVTSLAVSFLATISVFYLFPNVSHGILEFSTWVAITFTMIIFGEITPKIFGRLNPEKVTLFSLPILSRLVKIIYPFIWPFLKLIRVIFPRLDLIPVSRLTYLSLEEIKGLITEANTTGVLGKEASQMMHRVLRLGEINVKQIMTTVEKIEAVDIDQDEDKILDMVIETGRSRVPVYHSSINRIAGFVHTKDLLLAWHRNNEGFSHDLVRPAYIIPPGKKICELMRDFQVGKTHLAFVEDAFGNIMGLVTLEDVLEEIVGEILDEYDLKKRS